MELPEGAPNELPSGKMGKKRRPLLSPRAREVLVLAWLVQEMRMRKVSHGTGLMPQRIETAHAGPT